MRRIDLVSKLVAPLIVSLFTSVTSEQHSCLILLSISAFSTLFEYIFIGIVFNRFTILGEEERGHRQREEEQQQQQTQEVHTVSRPNTYPPRRSLLRHHVTFHPTRSLATWAHRQYTDWKTFAVMPIFISSLSISLLYASVLSFDSTFIGYLKSETTYSNAFIAGMKSVCVVTGLMGTSLSPFLTEKIGLTRTGSWSLWSELTPLSLTIVSFYRGAQNKHRPAWNTALLFTGLSLSRIGLWSFDLAQLAQVQLALSLHPNRNALMGLQFALQNLFDLFHYVIVIIFNKPSSFRIPADISFAAVGVATILYVTVYARRERGHLIHLNKVDDLLSLIRKKET
jgi:iron-regulated transporter 1